MAVLDYTSGHVRPLVDLILSQCRKIAFVPKFNGQGKNSYIELMETIMLHVLSQLLATRFFIIIIISRLLACRFGLCFLTLALAVVAF